MSKDIRFSTDARERMLRGVEILADAVRVTFGPRGRTVLIYEPFGAPRVTKTGANVARGIELEDRFENIGAQFVREAALKTSEITGDGTTTATILAHAILSATVKAVAAE